MSGTASSDTEGHERELGFGALVMSDLRAMARMKGTTLDGAKAWLDVLSLPGTWATLMVRAMNALHGSGLRPFSRLLYFANVVLFSCEVQPGVRIGPGFVMPHPVAVGMQSAVVVGANCHVMAMVRLGGGATDDPELDGSPHVGDDCWLLDGAKVFGGVRLGDRTVVAASTTVLDSFDQGDVILVGTPARVGKKRELDEVAGNVDPGASRS